jgi:serine/threonine protein kinase
MFCPDCGTWNRAEASRCTRCEKALPELEGTTRIEQPDPEITTLRKVTGDRYRILKRFASGGMAHVYLAVHTHLERNVVVKVLHAHLARDKEMAERFRREAEAACQLVHPHICPILDFGSVGEAVYIILPYLTGGSLADRLVKDRTIPHETAAAVAAQVACALDHAHRQGIVHRDVKPDNILFDSDGNSFITDFGIATARFHGRLTGTGRAMGTPHYMSPEQAMGKLIDGRSDLYALGVMMYEMIVGFPPFDGADSYSVGYKHVHEPPVALDVVDSKTPAHLNEIVLKALAKNPAERFQRGFEMADALVAFLSESAAVTELRVAKTSTSTGILPLAK